MEQALVNREYLLEKYPGKGGWTYVTIAEIEPSYKSRFGWVQVKGWIDSFELKQYKLMPMGNACLFLPVRAEIRKSIGKQAGDFVRVCLFADDSLLEVPNEILDCFALEDYALYKTFCAFSQSEQKHYIDWIYQAKTEETKANRITKMMERIQNGFRLYDKNVK